ncbi:hypothetical protein JCM17844_26880 [Iodidimonas gelatinilytica]|uniref:Uncharacterized protein n=1 Tax=Iodidimonas gelatinilytica TaxID=1236966 RepID=A0A5A7MSX9_9PROT|nr:hypothetical protein JCM17844_26880 [Iodidimonas gelatinilytica]
MLGKSKERMKKARQSALADKEAAIKASHCDAGCTGAQGETGKAE